MQQSKVGYLLPALLYIFWGSGCLNSVKSRETSQRRSDLLYKSMFIGQRVCLRFCVTPSRVNLRKWISKDFQHVNQDTPATYRRVIIIASLCYYREYSGGVSWVGEGLQAVPDLQRSIEPGCDRSRVKPWCPGHSAMGGGAPGNGLKR